MIWRKSFGYIVHTRIRQTPLLIFSSSNYTSLELHVLYIYVYSLSSNERGRVFYYIGIKDELILSLFKANVQKYIIQTIL